MSISPSPSISLSIYLIGSVSPENSDTELISHANLISSGCLKSCVKKDSETMSRFSE